MKQAYTPALQVVETTRLTRIRELPLPGKTLVKVGDLVEANSPVLSAELPGEMTIVRVAERMGFDPDDVVRNLRVKVGQQVDRGQLLCEIKTVFGLFTSQFESPATGEVEFITEENAHLGIRHSAVPFSVDAYVRGKIVAVEEGKRVEIETDGALIQGIFGVGGERQGEILCLTIPNAELVTKEVLAEQKNSLAGKILIGGSSFSSSALEYAATAGAVGVVTGSIDSQTLFNFVGYDIGVSITGDEKVPFTLIVTEGFGSLAISKRIVELAQKLNGRSASLNGATQVRAGATRPEVIVPDPRLQSTPAELEIKSLDIGARVRCVRVPYFGKFGNISELPHSAQKIESGAEVRVIKVKLDSGGEVVVPRANVELL